MQNVRMTVKGNLLIIEVDLSKTQGESKSGKSEIIGTTSGNSAVPGKADVIVGLNVYRKK